MNGALPFCFGVYDKVQSQGRIILDFWEVELGRIRFLMIFLKRLCQIIFKITKSVQWFHNMLTLPHELYLTTFKLTIDTYQGDWLYLVKLTKNIYFQTRLLICFITLIDGISKLENEIVQKFDQ